MLLPLTLALVAAVQSGGAGAPPDTVYFTPQVGQPTFAVREPVLRIAAGTVLISNTMFGDYYTEEGGAFPGDVGPIYVEGATTEDMLAVKIPRSGGGPHLLRFRRARQRRPRAVAKRPDPGEPLRLATRSREHDRDHRAS